jgi:heme/copper-type cytochrome/quinol oxidase subunit 3
MTVGLLSLSAFFAALIIAYSYRIEAQGTWRAFKVPTFLWLSTGFLALSSWLLEGARFSLRRGLVDIYRARLSGSILLGLTFLGLQITAGYNLAAQGVGTEANPHGSAFYIFMGIHAAHLTVGIAWMQVLLLRAKKLAVGTENDLRKHRIAASVAATYWHFMGVVWVVMFYCLLRWTRT